MPILVGIDGTKGDGTPSQRAIEEYDRIFANSFVRRLCEWGKLIPNKRYIRGPALSGLDLGNALSEGYEFIRNGRRPGVNEPILLTGYSRGALGVVNIAMNLKSENIPVRAMLLFDCVDMDPLRDAKVIPNNVENVLHVRRSPRSNSRPSWGNAATEPEDSSKTLYSEEFFLCTHGGMGGVPWTAPAGESPNRFIVEPYESAYRPPPPPLLGQSPNVEIGGGFGTNVTYAQDARMSDQVWNFVKSFILDHGFLTSV